jgi:cysteinyl-tRNA synthetase
LLARSSRDFDRADEIRQTLEEQGVLLDDGPDGTQWRRRG